MTASVTHAFVSAKADGADNTVVRPSDWNAAHTVAIAHGDLSSVTANQHHNQSHVIADTSGLGADHTTSGLTAGQVLRASSASAAAFAQLGHGDLGSVSADQHHAQSHTQSDHTGTGSTSTQALGDAASAGSGTKPANIDHVHGMPSRGYGLANNSTPAVSLTTAEAFATATTSVSAATYADITGVSVSLAAGTWLVLGQCSGSSVNAQAIMHVAITDGANTVVSEGSQGIGASGTANVAQLGNVSVAAIVSPGSTTTYKLRAARGLTTITGTWTAMDGAGTNTTNNLTDNSDKGTSIRAVRIA